MKEMRSEMKNKSRTQYSIMNMLASLGGYTLNIILSFVCRMIFARQLSADYLGVNGLFSNILSMLSLTELGIGTAMIYELYKPVALNDEKRITSYMKLYGTAYKIIGLVISILGVMLVPFLKFLINKPANIPENIYVLYLLFLFSTASSYFFSYRSSILIANQKNYIVVGISYAVLILQNFLQIIALIMTKNYMLYLILQVVFVFITNILISNKAVHDYPYVKSKQAERLSREELWSLIRNVKALTVTKLSGILVNNTDNLVITYFNGLVTTGVVSNYLLLTTTINSLVNQIFTSISASLGNLNATDDDEKKYYMFNVLNLANFWIYGWASVGIGVLSTDIVRLCFGEKYAMGIEIPLILAINFYMLGMQCIVGIYKSTMGLFRYGQYILLLTAGLNLLGDIILGKQFGVVGIFIATAIARMFTNTWYEPYIVYKYGLHRKFINYIIRYVAFAILLVTTWCVCYILGNLISLPILPRIIFKISICIIVPNAIFILAFGRRKEFQFFRDLVRRGKNKLMLKIKK